MMLEKLLESWKKKERKSKWVLIFKTAILKLAVSPELLKRILGTGVAQTNMTMSTDLKTIKVNSIILMKINLWIW
jgi:hypothetical protein